MERKVSRTCSLHWMGAVKVGLQVDVSCGRGKTWEPWFLRRSKAWHWRVNLVRSAEITFNILETNNIQPKTYLMAPFTGWWNGQR